MGKFTWGDLVRVRAAASIGNRLGALAGVVGMRDVETEEQSAQFDSPLASTIYLIEFGDGESVELPEHMLELAT